MLWLTLWAAKQPGRQEAVSTDGLKGAPVNWHDQLSRPGTLELFRGCRGPYHAWAESLRRERSVGGADSILHGPTVQVPRNPRRHSRPIDGAARCQNKLSRMSSGFAGERDGLFTTAATGA